MVNTNEQVDTISYYLLLPFDISFLSVWFNLLYSFYYFFFIYYLFITFEYEKN